MENLLREPTAWHRELYSALCGDLNGTEIQGRGTICIRVGDSPRCPAETGTPLKSNCTPRKKEKETPREFFLIIIRSVTWTIWNVGGTCVHFSLPGREWTALWVTLVVLIRRKCTCSFSQRQYSPAPPAGQALGPGCLGFHLPAAAWLLPPLTVRVIRAIQRIFTTCLLRVGHWASLIFNPENNPSWFVLFSPFYRWGNWDSEWIRGGRNIATCTSFYNISCYLTLHFTLVLEPA